MTPQPISCTACPLPAPCTPARPHSSSQQPAPTACTNQHRQRTPQPCRLPAAADQHHPRPPNGQKRPAAARCRRGQILYLPGISTMQYSRKLGYNSPYLSPYPLSSPLWRPAVALGPPWAPPAPARHRRPGLPPPCCCPVRPPPRQGTAPRRRPRCGFGSPKIFLGVKIFEGLPRFGPRKRVTGSKNTQEIEVDAVGIVN